MRRVLRLLGGAVVALVLAILVLGLLLRPPAIDVPPQADATFANVTIVNPGQGRSAGMQLRIRDGRIESIEPDRTSNGAQKFVMPGLIDMHVHTPSPVAQADRLLFGLLYLAHGVTTVRDVGNFDDSIIALRRATAEGRFPGPRILACGPLLDGDPPWWPGSRLVHDRVEARAVVDDLASQGVDCVKAYFLLSADALGGIREAAAAHQLPVIGHVPVEIPFESAHLADVQHLTGVPPSPPLRRRSEYFRWWGEGWRDVDSARLDFIVRTSVEQKIAHTPTIVVWQGMARALRGASVTEPSFGLVPSVFRDFTWRLAPEMVSPENATLLEASIPKMKDLVRRLHGAGVRIQAGTDVMNPYVVPGASLQAELRNFVAAGLTAEEALESATRAPGESLRLPGLGKLEVGAPADFLVLTSDPTIDLANLATVDTIVAQGRAYAKSDLDTAIQGHVAHAEGWLYRTVANAIARVMIWQTTRAPRDDIEVH